MNLERSEPSYWLALLYAPEIGPARYVRLLEYFGSPRAVFEAGRSEWTALNLPQSVLAYLQAPAWSQVDRDLAWLESPDNHILCLNDAAYPVLLKEIDRPPPVLFVRGNVGLLCSYQIAIVGTRNPTATGAQAAYDFAAHLAAAGITITSGLALGVDAQAHRGALAAGKTVAVMGTGLNRIYPSRHRDLAHAIADNGALVSELPLEMPAIAENFPRRNRILSGLTLGTVVVEAAVRSGSLITARLAAEQGREVFAIPGSIHNPMAKGCHALIRQGAKLVETATDILEELGPLAEVVALSETRSIGDLAVASTSADVKNGAVKNETLSLPELDQEYRDLLGHLQGQPVAIDVLVERSGLTAEVVSSMLLILELQGYVTAFPGGLYSRRSFERS